MRWLTILLLTTLALCGADRRRLMMQAPPAAAGGGCSTDSSETVPNNALQDFSIHSQVYSATVLVSTSTETICAAELFLKDLTGGGFTMSGKVEIWSLSGGEPDTLIDESDELDLATLGITGSYSWVTFPGLNWSKSSGTTYVILFHRTAYVGGGVHWRTENVGDPGHDTLWTSADGSSWTAVDIANLDRGRVRLKK
jgi:hypothetical protein